MGMFKGGRVLGGGVMNSIGMSVYISMSAKNTEKERQIN